MMKDVKDNRKYMKGNVGKEKFANIYEVCWKGGGRMSLEIYEGFQGKESITQKRCETFKFLKGNLMELM